MNYGMHYRTSIGIVGMIENDSEITHLYFGKREFREIEELETPLLKKAEEQLQEYLVGKRKIFDLPCNPHGTEFQQKVWKTLREIPYGHTNSYKKIAERIGNEKACRAVGMANNKNPIAIIIPCHRVIGASGKLIGYAGGLSMKQELLDLERRYYI